MEEGEGQRPPWSASGRNHVIQRCYATREQPNFTTGHHINEEKEYVMKRRRWHTVVHWLTSQRTVNAQKSYRLQQPSSRVHHYHVVVV